MRRKLRTPVLMSVCFECGAAANHDHHVVPKSLGGTKTVPLCVACHGLVHDADLLTMRALSAAANKRRKEERQRGIGGQLPYGFRKAGKTKGKWEMHPEEQEAILQILWLRTGKLSLQEIADDMNRTGMRTSTGGKWQAPYVRDVLLRFWGRTGVLQRGGY